MENMEAEPENRLPEAPETATEPVAAQAVPELTDNPQPRSKRKKPLVCAIVFLVLALGAATALLLPGILRGSPIEPAKKAFQAIATYDYITVFETADIDFYEMMKAEAPGLDTIFDRDAFRSFLTQQAKSELETAYGANVTVTVEILKSKTYGRKARKAFLEQYKPAKDSFASYAAYDWTHIKAVAEVAARIRLSGSESSDETESSLTMVHADGAWYCFSDNAARFSDSII
ncbi:MAG: hypothetical protein LBC83_00880 [Oscillospiraceae bacterium]|jgi:hypothetical protein|nr:hypothetical protein [Oscillospiraceae bacterium]